MTSNNKTGGTNKKLEDLFHDLGNGKAVRLNDYVKSEDLKNYLENHKINIQVHAMNESSAKSESINTELKTLFNDLNSGEKVCLNNYINNEKLANYFKKNKIKIKVLAKGEAKDEEGNYSEELGKLFHDLYLGKIIRLNDYLNDEEIDNYLEKHPTDNQKFVLGKETTKSRYHQWIEDNIEDKDELNRRIQSNDYEIKNLKNLFRENDYLKEIFEEYNNDKNDKEPNNNSNSINDCSEKELKEIVNSAIDKYEDNGDYSKKVDKSLESCYLVKNDLQVEVITDLFHFLESFLGGSDLTSTKPRNLLFRGQGSINYLTLPSLHRDAGHLSNEHKIYNELVTAYPEEFSSSNRHIDLLKLMQHYQLPTRLIDLTSNILVGLYFAVENNTTPTDAELQIFDANENTEKGNEEKHRVRDNNSDTVEILAALATQSFENKKDIYDKMKRYNAPLDRILPDKENSDEGNGVELPIKDLVINQFNNEKPVTYLLHEIRRMVGDFEPIIDPRDLKKTLLVKTHLDNPRIINQKGSFLIVGLEGFEDLEKNKELSVASKEKILNSIDDYRYTLPSKDNSDKSNDAESGSNNGNDEVRYIIPAAFKTKIKKQLDLLNINQMHIYPDLSNGSLYLKNLYSNNN